MGDELRLNSLSPAPGAKRDAKRVGQRASHLALRQVQDLKNSNGVHHPLRLLLYSYQVVNLVNHAAY